MNKTNTKGNTMNVKQLIEWLSKQDPELEVEIGMRQEYQNALELSCCQVADYNGKYILLGEPVQDWD
jgi:hypothetical protein